MNKTQLKGVYMKKKLLVVALLTTFANAYTGDQLIQPQETNIKVNSLPYKTPINIICLNGFQYYFFSSIKRSNLAPVMSNIRNQNNKIIGSYIKECKQ
jgi:hypothetical protein